MSLEIYIPVGPKIFLESHYVSVNEDEIIFKDTMMVTKDVIGFAYGPVEVIRNGFSQGIHYEFLLEDVAADRMQLLIRQIPSEPGAAEQYYNQIVTALWRYCGERMLRDFISTIQRGFTDQFRSLRTSKKGFIVFTSSFFGKDREDLIPWDEIEYRIDNGVLIVFSNTNSKLSERFSLTREINAHLLLRFLQMLKTTPDLKQRLKEERKI